MSSVNPNPSSSPAARFARRHRDVLFLAGLFALVLMGLAGLAAATGWAETMAQIEKLSSLQILALLGLSLVNYLFRGLRWHLFARRLGLPTTLARNLRHFIGGFAMSVTPGRVGELVRMRWLRRETGWPVDRTAPLVLADRASDLAALAVILTLAITFSTAGIRGALPVAALALTSAIVATRPRLLAAVAIRLYRFSGLWPRLFARIRRSSRSLARFSGPRIMASAALLGFVGWLAECYAFHVLLVWMGADIGFWTAAAIFIFASLAGGLTGAPGGVGGAEAAMLGLLMLQHVPLDMALPATLVIRVTTLWFAIGFGLAIFPFAERASQKAVHALENR